jgi:hypothetical protein
MISTQVHGNPHSQDISTENNLSYFGQLENCNIKDKQLYFIQMREILLYIQISHIRNNFDTILQY